MKNKIDIETAFKIFNWGVDYGLLKAEEERATEELADAFNMYLVDMKTSMPAYPVERRKLHSEKWFEAKNKSFREFKDFLVEDM